MADKLIDKTYDASGNLQKRIKSVMGTGNTGGGTTIVVTLVGKAGFSSASSYTVLTQDTTGAAATQVTYTSGTSFTITGTTGHEIRWVAIGS